MTIDWPNVSQFSAPRESAGYLLWQVTHLWQRQVESVLSELDITHLQFVLLAGISWLTRNGTLPTQVQLAEFCKIHIMQISQVARKLEVKKLIRRATHPIDTRAKLLMLTPTGEIILSQAIPLIETLDIEFFSACNHTVLLAELQRLQSEN
jgi:DNA-binding MarR family transcriptional regulator